MANDLLGCRLIFKNVLFCFWGQPDPTPRGSPSREEEVAPQSSARPCKGAAIWRSFLISHETLCIPQMFPHTCIISKTARGASFLTLPGRGPRLRAELCVYVALWRGGGEVELGWRTLAIRPRLPAETRHWSLLGRREVGDSGEGRAGPCVGSKPGI